MTIHALGVDTFPNGASILYIPVEGRNDMIPTNTKSAFLICAPGRHLYSHCPSLAVAAFYGGSIGLGVDVRCLFLGLVAHGFISDKIAGYGSVP